MHWKLALACVAALANMAFVQLSPQDRPLSN